MEYTPLDFSYPDPPKNVFNTTAFYVGYQDLRWDSATNLPKNKNKNIIGYNVYRSFDSELGPFTKINANLINATRYRDQTVNTLVIDEIVTDNFLSKGTDPIKSYRFKTNHFPIVKDSAVEKLANKPEDVIVKIDGIEVKVLKVDGFTGEITLINSGYYDFKEQKIIDPTLPSESSVITCTYKYNTNYVKADLTQRIFYKVTSVDGMFFEPLAETTSTLNFNITDLVLTVLDTSSFPEQGSLKLKQGFNTEYITYSSKTITTFNGIARGQFNTTPISFLSGNTVVQDRNGGNYVAESPLSVCSTVSPTKIDKINYIWKESVRRNFWLLEQTGDRVYLFIKKSTGIKCENYSPYHKQSTNNCKLCYGTGYLGGFSGPFSIIIAPPEATKSVNTGQFGKTLNYTYDSWTIGPELLTGDLIIKRNNQRYTISNCNPQGSLDQFYQTHFSVSLLQENDIRYFLPVTGAEFQIPDQYNQYITSSKTDADPTINDNRLTQQQINPDILEYQTTPAVQILKGRTVQWENINS